jgi:hypothetical protein
MVETRTRSMGAQKRPQYSLHHIRRLAPGGFIIVFAKKFHRVVYLLWTDYLPYAIVQLHLSLRSPAFNHLSYAVRLWPSATNFLVKQSILNSYLSQIATHFWFPGWPRKTDLSVFKTMIIGFFRITLTISLPGVKTQWPSQCQVFQRLARSSHALVNWTFDLLNRFSIGLACF